MKKIALCLSLFACAESASAPPTAPQPVSSATTSAAETRAVAAEPNVKKLDADTPLTTASGATFEGPKGWTVTTSGDRIRLETPEKDLSVTFIEVAETDGEKAMGKAWTIVKPAFALKAAQTVHPPAKDGWDSITQTVYSVGATEARSVIGIALGKGKTQYVALVDGANAGLDRRAAQLQTLIGTFRAAGVTEESFAGKVAKPLDAKALASIDETVRDVLAKMEVPGASMAIVEHGKVVFEKAYGTKTLGKNAPVSPNTLFMIGSTTKSLTTLMMAKLVDEKKLSWDEPVTEVLPSFALGDAEMTKKLTVKHTVCACTGLPRQDFEFLFEYANATPESRVGSMREMKPTTGFGETFQYSNTLVATGGYVAAHAAMPARKLGPAYAESMQANVFGPLGMKSTTLDFAKVKTHDHATGHAKNLDQTWSAIPIRDEEGVVALSPAGAVWSTARDMARYVAMELAKGKDASGRPIVSEANLLLRRTPQVKISEKSSYGLGLFVEDNHGVKVVGHGGNNLGFSSDMYFLPDHDIGVVLLYNGGGVNTVRNVVRRRLMEVLFDGKPETGTMIQFVKDATRDAVTKALARVSKADAAWAQSLAGSYSNPNLGQITVRADAKRATLDAGEWKSQFGKQTEDDGTAKLVLLEPPLAGLTLVPGPGRTLTLETPQQKYVFTATK
jgi:CubicO group peptidase (beta-lactamase class C family)